MGSQKDPTDSQGNNRLETFFALYQCNIDLGGK